MELHAQSIATHSRVDKLNQPNANLFHAQQEEPFHHTNATIIRTSAASRGFPWVKMHTNQVKENFKGAKGCSCGQVPRRKWLHHFPRVCVRARLRARGSARVWPEPFEVLNNLRHLRSNSAPSLSPPFSNQTRYLNCTLLLFSTKAMTEENIQ